MEIKLYEWQKATIPRAVSEGELALGCDMGTGKTGCAVRILAELMNKYKKPLRTLILGPDGVLSNWKREILKFSKIPEESIFISRGTGAKRVKDLHKALEKHRIVIINYEALLNLDIHFELCNWSPTVLICDESHMVKTPTTKRSKKVADLANLAEFRYIMTGTPFTSSQEDIFMQYLILDKGKTFGKNFWGFKNRYFYDKNANWKGLNRYPDWRMKPEMVAEFQEKVASKMIRVLKSECMDLPPRITVTYDLTMSPEQRKAYDEMKRDFLTWYTNARGESKAVVATIALTKLLRLMQINSGFLPAEEGDKEFKSVPKLEKTKELLKELTPNHKVIVWCSFKKNYEMVGRVCDDLKIPYVTLTGDDSSERKDTNIQLFDNNDEIRVMIANRRAGGVGVNLVKASYSIVYSRNFSLVEEKQSDDRNYRGGSQIHDKIVKIDLQTEDSIDALLKEAIERNQNMSDLMLDICKHL